MAGPSRHLDKLSFAKACPELVEGLGMTDGFMRKNRLHFTHR